MSLSNHEIFEISKAFIYLFFYISKSILFCFTRRDKNLNERLSIPGKREKEKCRTVAISGHVSGCLRRHRETQKEGTLSK